VAWLRVRPQDRRQPGYDKIKLRKAKLEQKDGNIYVVV